MKTEKQIKATLAHYYSIKDNSYSKSQWVRQQTEAYTLGLIHSLEWVLDDSK